uniref:Uncharacterized protein n=1 Tax=Ciona intestinalis TaxID=7719 RepID=H2XZR1_CIOIN
MKNLQYCGKSRCSFKISMSAVCLIVYTANL